MLPLRVLFLLFLFVSLLDEQRRIGLLQNLSTSYTRIDVAAVRASFSPMNTHRQKEFDAGELPDFLPETKHIRDDPSWRVRDTINTNTA